MARAQRSMAVGAAFGSILLSILARSAGFQTTISLSSAAAMRGHSFFCGNRRLGNIAFPLTSSATFESAGRSRLHLAAGLQCATSMAETASPTKPKTKGPAPLLVSKYLQSLSQVKEKLANEGRGLVWCGIGRDTFADALAIQLAQSGISSSSVSLKGYIFKEEGTLPGQYPSASAAVRMDILRYNAANAESFSGIADGAERNLRAAAEKYSVKITCFTLGAKGEPSPVGAEEYDAKNTCFTLGDKDEVGSKDFGPRPGIDARTQLFLVRKGDHFISVTKEASGAADELFANVALDEILPELERRAHTINLISDAEAAAELAASRETRPATQGGTALRGKAPMGVVVLGGGAPVPTLVRLSARRNPEERIWLLNQALMAEAGSVVVVPETGPAGSDLFVALVPALEVAGAGLRSPKVAGQGGNVMESGPATRMLRSEVIMYGQAHKSKLLNLQTPQMELASVALKYRVTVHLFTLSNLQETKEVFAPIKGVVSSVSSDSCCYEGGVRAERGGGLAR
ncbi:hypothetical protein T484DRAFT_1887218 [Baffinella frigidus]|nr:hypothetical protein T484DRAFT_1887218 [Cryptophyta sp. CCMP2293]